MRPWLCINLSAYIVSRQGAAKPVMQMYPNEESLKNHKSRNIPQIPAGIGNQSA